MAIMQVNFMSESLMRTVPMQVILPADKVLVSDEEKTEKEYKTLYLLHGLLGNYTDWVTNTNIQRYAEEKDLAVVMPSGENSFYVDGLLPNQNYGEFIGRELVRLPEKCFRSRIKERIRLLRDYLWAVLGRSGMDSAMQIHLAISPVFPAP